jgi:hypothetical protein
MGRGSDVEYIIYLFVAAGVFALASKGYFAQQAKAAKVRKDIAAKRSKTLALPAPGPVRRQRQPQFGRR